VSTSSSTSSTEPGDRLLEIGRVVRPHGLRGHVVVEVWTNRTERMAPGSQLTGPGASYEVVTATPVPGGVSPERWLVSFAGVASREAAETLRDVVLRAEALEDPEALWVHELIGAEVVDTTGVVIGRVEAVEANPASDLLVLEDGRLIPLRFISDRRPGRLTADLPPGLLDL
jgi:16S rRNA processing protein RimM